jgi:hypothetical protein
MPDRIYTLRDQPNCLSGKVLSKQEFDEAVRRVQLLADSAGEVDYRIGLKTAFSGINYIYGGISIDIGQARRIDLKDDETREVDIIKIVGSNSDINGLDKILISEGEQVPGKLTFSLHGIICYIFNKLS